MLGVTDAQTSYKFSNKKLSYTVEATVIAEVVVNTDECRPKASSLDVFLFSN